jgi:crossover junction endodeoxyribonuclease RuvC
LKLQEKNKLSESCEFTILGIDPGSINCGYGLIKSTKDRSNFYKYEPWTPVYITSGRITMSPKSPMYLRLKKLYDSIIDVIRDYKPVEMVIESMFFAKSVRAAFGLGQARGAAFLAAASEGISVFEYSAREVKKAVTGYGGAEKRQVQEMVKRILNIQAQTPFISEDSADALALAICHLHSIRLKEKIKEQNDRFVKRKTFI